MTRKSSKPPTCDIRNTEQVFRSYLVSNAYRDLHHKRMNRQPQNAEKLNFYQWGHQFMPHISDAKSILVYHLI